MPSPAKTSTAAAKNRGPIDPLGAAVAVWLAPAYSLLIAIGTLTLHLTALGRGSPMTVDKAFFASINAVTLTGFRLTLGIDQYRPIAQGMMLLLISAGSILALFVGGMATVRVMRLAHDPWKMFLSAVAAEWLALLAGMVLLDDANHSLFTAAFQAAAAFGNCGLTLGRLPAIASLPTHVILMPAALIGGLGLPVLIELFELAFLGRKISRYTQTILTLSAAAYLIGFVLVATLGLIDARHAGWFGGWSGSSVRSVLLTASVLSIDCRTAGLPLAPIDALPRTVQWALIPLMIVGASPGGSGGGLKLTTALILGRGVRQAASGKPVNNAFRTALLWAGLYFGMALLCFLIILGTDPQTPADQLLFTAFSAASNVGLSQQELTGGPPTLFTLGMTMLLARVASLLTAWWMVETVAAAELPTT